MKRSRYKKVHPKWEVRNKCEHCGKVLIANGIKWHGDKCVWKGIDMSEVYTALKNNMSVKNVMDTFGTTEYTTNQLKKGFYPDFPKISVDGRKGHMNYSPKKEKPKPKSKGVYYDSQKVWELLEIGLDISEIYRILDKPNKKNHLKKGFYVGNI